jgi:hypothetical protein
MLLAQKLELSRPDWAAQQSSQSFPSARICVSLSCKRQQRSSEIGTPNSHAIAGRQAMIGAYLTGRQVLRFEVFLNQVLGVRDLGNGCCTGRQCSSPYDRGSISGILVVAIAPVTNLQNSMANIAMVSEKIKNRIQSYKYIKLIYYESCFTPFIYHFLLQ